MIALMVGVLAVGIVVGVGAFALFCWVVKYATVDDERLFSTPRGWR